VDPIDEIDGKKKRRTMLENMQRSSALFQSKVAKPESKAAEKAKAQQQQAPDTSQDQLDFSSEFSNQQSDFRSDSGQDVLNNWEDLIDDDDWLNEDEEDDSQEEEGQGGHQTYEEEETEEPSSETPPPSSWKPFKKADLGGGRGFTPISPSNQPPAKAEEPKPTTEQKLGFEWGSVQEKKAPVPPEKEEGSAEPNLKKVKENVPLSATRRGGWQSFPGAADFSSRPRPVAATLLPPRGQLAQVESGVVNAARLLIVTPDDEPGYEECVRLLGRFGLGAIRRCSRAKVKVHILDVPEFARFPELVEMDLEPEEFPVDGAYLAKSRTCLIDRRCLTEKPRFFHPALYYFAHALDHAQGGEDFSSRQAAAVLACYDASCTGLHGADFVDELAACDPVRYFARSVSIYLGRDDCTDPIWTHQDLYDFDRSMYDYLQYLFARFST
jgi:hypothetical protein